MKRFLILFISMFLLCTSILSSRIIFAEENEPTVDFNSVNEVSEEDDGLKDEEESAVASFDETDEEAILPVEEMETIEGDIVSIEEYDPSDPSDPQNSTSFYQDEESGDVYIMSENSVWLSELYDQLNDFSSRDDYHVIILRNEDGFNRNFSLAENDFETGFLRNDNDELIGIRVSKNLLYGFNVPSGKVTVVIPSTSSYNQVSYTFDNLEACLDTPEGLII